MRELSQENLRKVEASFRGKYNREVWLIPKYEYGTGRNMWRVLEDMGFEVRNYLKVGILLIVTPPRSWKRQVIGHWTYIKNSRGKIKLYAYFRNTQDCYLKLPK